MINNTLISCIIPSYKRSDTLKRAIDSILAQTYQNLEILVVDDNVEGDDYSLNLKRILQQFKEDKRVRLITQPSHVNGAEARNAGIRAARGEWVAFLDDDDEWLPNKIEQQIALLMEHPDCMGVSCFYNEYINNQLVHSCPPYNTDDINYKIFSRQVAVFTSTVLLNKNKLLEFGAFNNRLRRHQDLQLLLDFTSHNSLAVVPEYLVKLHLDSDINRPSLDLLIQVKCDFFSAMEELYKKYSDERQKLIMNAHYYEIVFSAIKNKRLYVAMTYMIKAGISLQSVKMLVQRIKDRKYKVDIMR